jgi:hypothetical protein
MAAELARTAKLSLLGIVAAREQAALHNGNAVSGISYAAVAAARGWKPVLLACKGLRASVSVRSCGCLVYVRSAQQCNQGSKQACSPDPFVQCTCHQELPKKSADAKMVWLTRIDYYYQELQEHTHYKHNATDAVLTSKCTCLQVMEAREQVEQEHDQEQLVKLHSENKQRQATLCKQLGGAFGRSDIDGARQLVAQLSYWVRLEEAICDKL